MHRRHAICNACQQGGIETEVSLLERKETPYRLRRASKKSMWSHMRNLLLCFPLLIFLTRAIGKMVRWLISFDEISSYFSNDSIVNKASTVRFGTSDYTPVRTFRKHATTKAIQWKLAQNTQSHASNRSQMLIRENQFTKTEHTAASSAAPWRLRLLGVNAKETWIFYLLIPPQSFWFAKSEGNSK